MGKTIKRSDKIIPSHKVVEDFLALSHKILRYSSWNVTRIELLREISNAIREFAGCDVVEFCIEEDDTQYYWKANFVPDETYSYKLMPRIHCEIGDTINQIETDPERPSFCISLLRKQLDPTLPFFTRHGSFWTGDAENPFAFQDSNNERTQLKIHLGKGYKSIALIPFVINDENQGILILKSPKSFFFTENEIEFFEGVAQTLGLTVAYRRTQVAIRERVKELTCLYGIAQIADQSGITVDELLSQFVELLPPAMRFPELAIARIVSENKSYFTKGYVDSRYKCSAPIIVNKQERGFIEVSYKEEGSTFVTNPFLKEEEKLIDTVAKEISLALEERLTLEYKTILQEQLRHADRLATIGQLAAGVAHELNEPLGSILGFAQIVKKSGELPPQSSADCEKIVSAALHAREIVRKLLIFARQVPADIKKTNINEIVKDGLYFLESRLAKEGIDFEIQLAPDLPGINADPTQLHQVLVNLVVNAIQSMTGGGKLTVKTGCDHQYVYLIIQDTGVGMSKEVLSQIFNPFFTTKDIGQGTGLGLSVVHGIVTSHGGSIDVKSKLKQGSQFTVKLPIHAKSTEEGKIINEL